MPLRGAQVSVIVTTYNRPDALEAVLRSLETQREQGFEVLVADDGSGPETAQLLTAWQAKGVRHVWQPDQGFRAAAARNRALAQAERDYVIFIDGDCVLPPEFIQRHCALAEAGWFVAGNRVLCSPGFTRQILNERLPVWAWPRWRWLWQYALRRVNRFAPLLFLPLPRKLRPRRWEGAKTCNMAAWRRDLLAVNGFDESFQGWGHEDADLAVRLIRHGILRKSGHFAAPVFHLWHPAQSRKQEAENKRRLRESLAQRQSVRAERGVSQYL